MLRRPPPSRPRRPRGGLDRPDAACTRDLHAFALELLARRDFSVAQLRQRLLEVSDDTAEVAEILLQLTAEGTLDDRRTAHAVARTAAQVKGRGRLRVLRELSEAGIADEIARAAVDEAFPPEEAAALMRRAIARHVRGPLRDERAYRRAYAALMRRGFAAAEVRAALRCHARGDAAGAVDDVPEE